jgi:hypothetical protein
MDFVPRPTVIGDVNPRPVSLRCPHCGKVGSLVALKGNDFCWQQNYIKEGKTYGSQVVATVRRCPADDCSGLVFAILRDGAVLTSFPSETIDFEAAKLPLAIKQSLEEAIKAHAAQCYRASALMVRRALEEVCEDRKAKGANLKERLSALGSVALIPAELLSAADEIRILGNEAAHVKASVYDVIDRPHAEVAIELTKEILKAVYQYSTLLEKLKALKKPVI